MDELERLRLENARLDSEEEVKKDIASHQREKDKLKREIWAKKHPKVIRVVKVAKRSTVGVGMIAKKSIVGIGMILKDYTKNYEAGQRRQAPRRVVKVKRIKKKSPKKKRIVRVKRVQRRSSPNIPNFNDFF